MDIPSWHVVSIRFFIIAVVVLLLAPLAAYATPAAQIKSSLFYTFNKDGVLSSASKMDDSSSPYFWITAGARLVIKDGVGQTTQGALPATHPQRIAYSTVNPLDTANGYYPQNTFRLVTRSAWGDSEATIRFNIVKTNLTNTPNRDGYSGVFLESRYIDANNVYYAGVRHDGLAILKKKIGGVYHTLTYKQAYGTTGTYNRTTNPNLLPQNKWVGLKLRTTNLANGSVKLELLADNANNGKWTTLVTYVDTGIGGATFSKPGFSGVRTDYMDVLFDNFEFKSTNL
jgi:hypothetical protein